MEKADTSVRTEGPCRVLGVGNSSTVEAGRDCVGRLSKLRSNIQFSGIRVREMVNIDKRAWTRRVG